MRRLYWRFRNSVCKDLAFLAGKAVKVVAWWGNGGAVEPCHLSLGGGSEACVVFDSPRSAEVEIDVCWSMPVPAFVEKYLGSFQESGLGKLIIEARGSVVAIAYSDPDIILDTLRWIGLNRAVVENGHVVAELGKGLREFRGNLKKVLEAFAAFKKFLSTNASVEVPGHAKKFAEALNRFLRSFEGGAEAEVRAGQSGKVAYCKGRVRVCVPVMVKVSVEDAEVLVPAVAGLVACAISCVAPST